MSTSCGIPPRVISHDGAIYLGTHLLVDVWGAVNLDDIELIKGTLINAAVACNANLVKIDLHRFTPNGGVSGIALLSQSHISIHSWPEHDFAAIDIFMCAEIDCARLVAVLEEAFCPTRVDIVQQRRGVIMP